MLTGIQASIYLQLVLYRATDQGMGRREGFPGEAALRLRRMTRRMKKEMGVGVERVRVHGQRGWKVTGSLWASYEVGLGEAMEEF